MALFKKDKKKQEVEPVKEVKTTKAAAPTPQVSDLSWVLHSPRLSEKAMYASDNNVYVFNIDPRANKTQITQAIKDVYKVEPKKINISKIAKKNIRNQRTGIRGVKSGGKKAYIYLKGGDKINIV